jgi:hypothetical protein
MIGKETEEKYKKIIKTYGKMREEGIDKLIENLKNNNLSISYIKTILSALKWNEGERGKHEEEYKEAIRKISEKQSKQEKHLNKFKKIDWKKIKKIKGKTVDDLILGLYSMFPPRRIKDYAFMVYVKNRKGVEDDDENYYISDEHKFLFQNYKTIKTYGKQEFQVSKKLKDLIEGYVKENEIKDGEPLIKYRTYKKDKNKFNKRYLSQKLTEIFGTSVDGIRHAYITWLYKNPKNLYNIEEISEKMGHDVKTHLRYLDKENKN